MKGFPWPRVPLGPHAVWATRRLGVACLNDRVLYLFLLVKPEQTETRWRYYLHESNIPMII